MAPCLLLHQPEGASQQDVPSPPRKTGWPRPKECSVVVERADAVLARSESQVGAGLSFSGKS